MGKAFFKKLLTAVTMGVLLSVAASGCGNNKEVTINEAADLGNYTIGCQSGTTGETWCLDNISKIPKSFKSGMDAAIALSNGQIDAVVLDELPAKAIVEKNSGLKILDIKFAKEEYAIAVAKGDTELLESINKTIGDMRENGEYQALCEAFMPADGQVKLPEKIQDGGDKSLKVGTNAAFYPFEYVDGNNIVGFDITMSQYIAKDYGATLQVVDMAFDSLVAALQSGNIDMVAAGFSVTEERAKNVDFSNPYYESEQVIIVRS